MMKENQTTHTLLMVRPANFGFNPETADNNAFQSNETALSREEISAKAQMEFDAMADGLRSHGIEVIVHDDTMTPAKTDAVFPNNWFSTHEDGRLFLYPMYSPNRRLERADDLINQLQESYNYNVDKSLLAAESDALFLEGTGSMILDRVNKVVYACYSERTNPTLLAAYGGHLSYRVCGWTSTDSNGLPYYHTNVIMALGQHVAIICTESIVDKKEKYEVINSLTAGNFEIIEISRDQVLQYAGNMLEVQNQSGDSFMIMSSSAYKSLTIGQLDIIKKYNTILHYDLSTIEHFGGGSARCMMAEIFEPCL